MKRIIPLANWHNKIKKPKKLRKNKRNKCIIDVDDDGGGIIENMVHKNSFNFDVFFLYNCRGC